MGIGFEEPFDLQSMLFDIDDDPIGRRERRASRSLIEVQHRIDNRSGMADRIMDDISGGIGRLVERRVHDRKGVFAVACHGDDK